MPPLVTRGLRALVLDAGNTLVFLDHDRLADVAGGGVPAATLRASEGRAKRHYQELLAQGVDHLQGFPLYFETLFVEAGMSRDAARAAVPRVEEAHRQYNLFSRVPEGVPEALDRARAAGLRLGVVSNSEGTLAKLLDGLGLGTRLSFVLDSTLEGVSKPDPEIFRRALTRLGVAPHEAVYAGDIPDVDVAGARAAGMHAVLVDPFGHFEGYTDAPRVDGVVALVDALLASR